ARSVPVSPAGATGGTSEVAGWLFVGSVFWLGCGAAIGMEDVTPLRALWACVSRVSQSVELVLSRGAGEGPATAPPPRPRSRKAQPAAVRAELNITSIIGPG